MSRSTHSLLTALLSTTVVVTAALAWGGWRLLDQQRAIDEQRVLDQVESAADAAAADIRGRLAETGEQLSGWLSNPSSRLPAIDGGVVIGTRPDGIDVNPAGGLPFVPVAVQPARASDSFSALEAMEFGTDRPQRAADGYRLLARGSDPQIRAGALLRLGRVLRKSGDFSGALATYRQLAGLGLVRAEDLPAELAGLEGQRSTYIAMGNAAQAREVGGRMVRGLDSGRWRLARGTAEFYRDRFQQPRDESWTLAGALSDTWRETQGSLPARGQRVFGGHEPGSSVLVLWRSNGTHTAALAAPAGPFFKAAATGPTAWQLVDPEGHMIAGLAGSPPRAVTRIIGNAEYPWTLRVWTASSSTDKAPGSRAILLAMMGATLVFVWGAAFFMAHAIRREAAVARLQSDFVAAVSHEFRSPLTSVRQMAEMLDGNRVPTEERRHTYYRVLAGQAARLERLVETLLNFGKMEAGAERYRFVDLDAAALLRDVVGDIEPHARESGKVIETAGPDTGIRVLGDHSALTVVLWNLIDNAIKYSPDQPTVWVRWRKDDGRAAICVIDRGVGIPPSEQLAIFRKFVRGRAAIDANIKGTGLGLSMVQQIVTAHGGEIRLDSEPGRGSTFTVLLPAVN